MSCETLNTRSFFPHNLGNLESTRWATMRDKITMATAVKLLSGIVNRVGRQSRQPDCELNVSCDAVLILCSYHVIWTFAFDSNTLRCISGVLKVFFFSSSQDGPCPAEREGVVQEEGSVHSGCREKTSRFRVWVTQEKEAQNWQGELLKSQRW